MKVQVSKWGNSTAVRLPKTVVRELGLSQGMTLDVTVDDGAVKLVPIETSGADASVPTPMPRPVTLDWIVSEIRRLGPENDPADGWEWGPDVGSEVIYDDYNPRKPKP